MTYYYVCDRCGKVEEQEFSDKPVVCYEHDLPVAMRIVTKEDIQMRSTLTTTQSSTIRETAMTLLTAMIAIAGVCFIGILVILMIKLWVWIW